MSSNQATYNLDYQLSDTDENVHHDWDNSRSPVLTVEPGDVVRFECRDSVNGQIDVETDASAIPDIDPDPIHPLTGPVAIEGAEPGEVLEIELLNLQHKGWGFTTIYPGETGLGLLPEAFPDPDVHIWNLVDDRAHFVNDITVPIDPFPGVIGVAPREEGAHETIPPRSVGGNVDIKHLTAGSTLYLPVDVRDGLFSVGDCHAAQGDGEVCVNGIEAPMFVTARFDLRSDLDVEQPQFVTEGPFTPAGNEEKMYCTSGVDSDLMGAAKKAVGFMITHLHQKHDLNRSEAYMLCSAAVDLKINEAVNAPNWVVSAYLPLSIFPE